MHRAGSPRLKWLVGLVIGLEAALLWLPPGRSMLDARVYYSADEALSYVEALGAAGRTQYFVHECVDLVFIAAYTTLFQQLAEKWRLSPRVLLILPGAADFVETAGILALLRTNPPRARLLAGLVGYATCSKWGAFAVAMVTLAIALHRRKRIRPH